ncbi:uncharacterized protein LOC143179386 [Calliopsis andreniformis]|uniref:uncharacterized protein LOC143179386 n=1 Tax=Calliopsis andreniformis TaxID=337506 RepID=UPI003FCEA582
MTITPVSPCYMKSTESSQWQLLKLGSAVPIKPGDIFFLMPYKCWFKIILVPEMMEDNQEFILKRKANEDADYNISNKKLCSRSGEGDNLQSSNDLLNEMLCNNNDIIKLKDETTNKGNNKSSKDEDKKLQLNSMELNKPQEISYPSSLGENNLQSMTEGAPNILKNKETLNNSKNSHSTDKDNELVTTEDTNPLHSVGTDESNNSTDVTASTVRREKCKYNKKCYRRNPQHRDKYSHPGDFDYDYPDDRQECPYGVRCYRKNSQHKMQYKHTAIKNKRKGANGCSDRNRKQRSRQVPLDDLSETENLSADESDEESVEESEYEPSSDEENSDDESEWEDDTID